MGAVGVELGGHFGTNVWPDISKPTHPGSENRDPFIYSPFKNNTYTYTSMVHIIASRTNIRLIYTNSSSKRLKCYF